MLAVAPGLRKSRALLLLASVLLIGGCGEGVNTVGNSTAVSTTSSVGGSATLTWVTPTQNTDGTAATDVAGFYVHYGNSADDMTGMINVSGASATTYVISGLAPGTYYFAVSAYNSQGVEGPLSNTASKTI